MFRMKPTWRLMLNTWTPKLHYCSSCSCPRIRHIELADQGTTGEMETDQAGHIWCSACSQQRELMDWACANQWPSTRVQSQMRYAIMGGADDWFTSVATANADMVRALYETLITRTRAPLSMATNEDEHAKRVFKWLSARE